MSYKEITKYNSPNFTPYSSVGAIFGYHRKIEGIVIHHWGDPKHNPQFHSIVSFLCRRNGNTSAHVVATGTGRQVAWIIDAKNAAWHSGSAWGNARTIGIECDPRARSVDYDVVGELIADIWIAYKTKLPLYPHKKFSSTACPGAYNLAILRKYAEKWYALKTCKTTEKRPVKPAPTPKKRSIKYEKITPTMIKTSRDAKLWDFNFTNYKKAKAIRRFKKGTVIENIVAIATNSLGARYYMTAYSYNNGKNIRTTGINVVDANIYTPNKAPTVEPKPPKDDISPTTTNPDGTVQDDTGKPITEKIDYIEKRIGVIERTLDLVVTFIASIFKGFKKGE